MTPSSDNWATALALAVSTEEEAFRRKKSRSASQPLWLSYELPSVLPPPEPSELVEPARLPPSELEVVAVVVVELEPPSEPELDPDVLLPLSDPEPESEVPPELPDPEPEDELSEPPSDVGWAAGVSFEPSCPLPDEPSPDEAPTSPLPSCEPDGSELDPAPLRERSRPELPPSVLLGVTAAAVGAGT
jgi:hypothetical protein